MYKYFNEVIVCNQLSKENKDIKKELDKSKINFVKLKKEYNDLQYKYDGLLECKNDIYTKYQNSIVKNS
jgi:hypothetical protein